MNAKHTTPHVRRRRGFSLIELLIVIAIILTIAAIAVTQYDKVRILVNEMAVVRELETIYIAQTQYHAQFGKYASTLLELGPPSTGGASSPSAAELIPKALAEGSHNGYRYTMAGTQMNFAVAAQPESFNHSGRRTFYLDQTKILRQNWSQEPATAQSAPY